MQKSDVSELDTLIERGLAAVENEDLEEAEAILQKAEALGSDHPRVLHLTGLIAWAGEDLEEACELLQRAADGAAEAGVSDAVAGSIKIDCAECLFMVGENGEAEAMLRGLLEKPAAVAGLGDEARLLLAQVRLDDDDPDEALEILADIDAARHTHPAYRSTKAAALLGAGQGDEALTELREALKNSPDDGDLYYQEAMVLQHLGRDGDAKSALVKVLELDSEDDEPLDPAIPQELRERLEAVFEELPDQVLELVAHAPVQVQGRVTAEQIRLQGVSPRRGLVFLGTPARDGEGAQLTGILIAANVLMQTVSDEDMLEEELFYALMEEIQEFFQRDDLVVAAGLDA